MKYAVLTMGAELVAVPTDNNRQIKELKSQGYEIVGRLNSNYLNGLTQYMLVVFEECPE